MYILFIAYESASVFTNISAMLNAKGLFYTLLSGFAYSLQSMFAKQLEEIPKVNIAPFRSVVQLTLFIPVLQFAFPDSVSTKSFVQQITVPEIRNGIIGRAFWGYLAICTLFFSLNYLSIGDSSAIRAMVAPVTAVLAYFMLKEKMNALQVILMLVSVSGMVFIAQPWVEAEAQSIDTSNYSDFERKFATTIGCCVCFMSVLGNSICAITIRGLGKRVHFWILTFYHCLFGVAIVLPIWVAVGNIDPAQLWRDGFLRQDAYLMCVIAICGTTAQVTKKLALDYEKAVIVQMVGNTQVIFSYLLQYFILGNVPNFWSIIGAVLIFVSVVGLGWQKMAKSGKNREVRN